MRGANMDDSKQRSNNGDYTNRDTPDGLDAIIEEALADTERLTAILQDLARNVESSEFRNLATQVQNLMSVPIENWTDDDVEFAKRIEVEIGNLYKEELLPRDAVTDNINQLQSAAVWWREHVRDCAAAIKRALDRFDLSGLPSDTVITDISDAPSCIDPRELRTLGITAPTEVLDMLTRIPLGLAAWTWLTYAHCGLQIPNNFKQLVADTVGQFYWAVRNAASLAEAQDCINGMLQELDDYMAGFGGTTIEKAKALASQRPAGQRWIVDGVYDRSILGRPTFKANVERWGIDILLCGLSGRERSEVLKEYRRSGDAFAFMDQVLLLCARDPRQPDRLYFQNEETIEVLHSTEMRRLAKIALQLSGFLDIEQLQVWRQATDSDDLAFLLRITGQGKADSCEQKLMMDIARYFLWDKQAYWRTSRESAYGLIRRSLDEQWREFLRTNHLKGDTGGGRDDNHGRIPREVPFGYVEQFRQSRTIEAEHYWQEIETDYTTAELMELEISRRRARNPCAPASLTGSGFDELATVESDIESAFEAIAGVGTDNDDRDWSPLPNHSKKNPEVVLPGAAIRDLEVFVMRYLDCFDRRDIPKFAGKPVETKCVAQACAAATSEAKKRTRMVDPDGRCVQYRPDEVHSACQLKTIFAGMPEAQANAAWRNLEPYQRRGCQIIKWLQQNGYGNTQDFTRR